MERLCGKKGWSCVCDEVAQNLSVAPGFYDYERFDKGSKKLNQFRPLKKLNVQSPTLTHSVRAAPMM